MEKFYLEEPSQERKKDILDYLNEFVLYNSDVNGAGALDKILSGQSFEEALDRCLNMKNEEYAKKYGRCQSKTFLLIRKNDNKLIGMINVRWNLTEEMKRFGGNIGYGIRPTERRKGYNKINLYLALEKAKNINLNKVLLTADDSNIGSVKTILSLGGKLENKIFSYENNNVLMGRYWIDVNKSLDKYFNSYKNKMYRRE